MSRPSDSSSLADGYLGQSVIPVVNRLQDIFSQLGATSVIDLPQVAVVGSQSSGKSSVLEALVGRDFLPRGSEIVTRRPLVLQLIHTPKREGSKEGAVTEWGEFLHLPGKKFTDFNAIREEIQLETDRETGSNKGISEKQIRLKIFSPNVLNITLVDLPGITKVPVGDQPTDIEARVRTMILSYIKHESCIILAVSPANADLANSDALQMARIADPDGSRTIGVITKLDIMDRGTDARNFLLGNVIPLRLGYVGVVNRCQEDINSKRSIKDAIAFEEGFFRSRPVYHGLADRCGVAQLAKKLNTILVQHIRTLLPELKARINTQMVSIQKELASYGEAADKANRSVVLLNLLTKYSLAFSAIVEGKNEAMSTSELSGGARIHYIFQSIFVRSLEDVDPCDDLSDEDIRTAIQNATGTKNVLFVPEVPFEVLVRRQIARLLDPSLQCARFVYDELVKISHRCEGFELQRFPVLRKRIEETVGSFLREGLAPAETMIGHLINMEMDYINTSHPSFIGGSRAVDAALREQRVSPGGDHDSALLNGMAPSSGTSATNPSGSGTSASSAAAGGLTAGGDKGGHGRPRGMLARGTQDTPSSRAGATNGATDKHGRGAPNNPSSTSHSSLAAATAATAGTAAPGVNNSNSSTSSWGISSMFGGTNRGPSGSREGTSGGSAVLNGPMFGAPAADEPSSSSMFDNDTGLHFSTITLKEPPAILRASNDQSGGQDSVEIRVTRILLKSYYDIVRKNVQDVVPKAIMHFLVNHVKRDLHNVFIQELYREPLFEDMLQEREEVAQQRTRCKEVFRVLQQAAWALEELPLDADSPHRPLTGHLDATGLPSSHFAVRGPHAGAGGGGTPALDATRIDASLAMNPYSSAAFQSPTQLHATRQYRRVAGAIGSDGAAFVTSADIIGNGS